MRKSFHIALTLAMLSPIADSQDFQWSAGLDGFLDNREYFSIDIPQTIFGARVRGEIGGSLNAAPSIITVRISGEFSWAFRGTGDTGMFLIGDPFYRLDN
jgi:hypothetical protein